VRIDGSRPAESVVPGGNASVALPVDVTSKLTEPGLHAVALPLSVGGRAVRPVTAMIEVPLTAGFVATPPRIDGNPGEWTSANAFEARTPGPGTDPPPAGNRDLGAHGFLAWDAQNLYVVVAVLDDKALEGDCVQLSVSRGATVSGFRMASRGSRAEVKRVAGAERTTDALARLAMRRLGSRTYYEAAVPWLSIADNAPKAGDRFRFAVRAIDDDGEGERFLGFGGGSGPELQPGAFALAMLGK
jgi:hypothetical protein